MMPLFRGYSTAAALFSFALAHISPGNVLGCACCTDRGEYRLVPNGRMSEYQRAQLESITFGPAAELYLTDAGEDVVKGVGSVTPENTISVAIEGKQWRMTFRSAEGKSGTLRLPIPARLTTFAADLHDSEDLGRGPTLYKEWRIESVAQGDGIFRKGFAAPARYSLIFQGRGNRCDDASDFTHLRLEITGEKASYAYFGKLVNEAGK
jgi:hypothetical protein